MRFRRKDRVEAKDRAHVMKAWIERIETRVAEVERRLEIVESDEKAVPPLEKDE